MRVRNIFDKIYYVGVNDRRTHKFEGMWPLPYGVSYNSYVVAGSEKTALIDTVDCGDGDLLISQIMEVCGNRCPDYLVVNHMEPDHSGALPGIVRAFPEIKIVCNKIAKGMISGFYHIVDDGRFVVITDGAELSLGDKTLVFVQTPMVHWPETMMTYLKESNVLFTGDALGTFGALNGAVLDDDMECGTYLEEMYRYYSNIVGKYGMFVRKALDKLKSLDIEYACPTHGPVWHSLIDRVMDIYGMLSDYRSEDGVVVVYGSMYGNTAEVAEHLAEAAASCGHRKIKVYDASSASLSDMISDCFRYNKLIIGAPTYSGTLFPPVDDLMKALALRDMKNKRVLLFGSYTWASGALKELNGYCERMKLDVVGSVDVRQRIDADAVAEINEMVKKL